MASAATGTAPTLLGMGNPLLDISAEVSAELVEKYGVAMNNAILAEEKHLPLYKEMVEKHAVEYIAGGATQNTIRVAQWMSSTPGTTAYIGCVGRDAFGEQLKAAAEADGVAVHYLVDESTPTGTCAVLIQDKERSLVANLAAANNYKIDHLNTEPIQDVVKGAKVFYSAGFFLTVSPDSMVAVGKHAAETGKVYAMNLSAPFLPAVFKDAMASVMPYADIVFGNESEAEAYAAANGLEDKSVEGVAKAIAALPKASGTRSRTVIITQGSNATVVARDGAVTTYAVPKIAESEIVDLNGAGDAFVGGFLAKFGEGKAFETCINAGHYAAGVIIRRSGCTMPEKCEFSEE